MSIRNADDHAAALAELDRLWGGLSSPSQPHKAEEVQALVEAYEAEAHRRVRQDVIDVSAWLLLRDPAWRGFVEVFVPPGPDPREITAFWVYDPRLGEAQKALNEDASAAFRALGYGLKAANQCGIDAEVKHPDPRTLSAHQRLEGYRRIEDALTKCHLELPSASLVPLPETSLEAGHDG